MRPPVIPPEHVARIACRVPPFVRPACERVARTFLLNPNARPGPLSAELGIGVGDCLKVRRLALDMDAEGRL